MNEDATREALTALKEAYYPSHELDDVLFGEWKVEFAWSRADHREEFICEAALLRGRDPILLCSCHRQQSGYPPDVRYYALRVSGGGLRDVRQEIFPIEEIVDALGDWVVDEDRMRQHLASPELRERLIDAIQFSFHSDPNDSLLVTLGNVADIVEGAAFVPLRWNETTGRFE